MLISIQPKIHSLLRKRRPISTFVQLLCVVFLSLFTHVVFGQQDSTLLNEPDLSKVEGKILHKLENKYNDLQRSVEKQSMKLLQRLEKKETRLRNALQTKDSAKAKALFDECKYQQLQNKLKDPLDKTIQNPLKEYIPNLDSLQTAMRFLEKSGTKLPVEKLQQVKALSDQLQSLQGKMQQANEIQQYVRERSSQLKEQLSQYGLGKQLAGINKEAFYYQQRLSEYKSLLKDRKKLEEKLLKTLRESSAFKSFMKKNSYLAQLFPMPANYGSPEALAGLQTRAQVESLIAERIGGASTSVNPQQYLEQQMQQAQSQLNELKDKVNQLGGGSSDMVMLDFKPNQQKTKTFFRRLEYGFNIQSQGSTSLLPSTSDIALTLGYKLSDKASAGIGASYKLGIGRGWNHIQFSNQGVGLRSYVDIKTKGSVWISGGLEYNYMEEFRKWEQVKDLDLWQKSGLIGLTKKYKAWKKEARMQLLYDLLHQQQVPRTQALKFRVGYNF